MDQDDPAHMGARDHDIRGLERHAQGEAEIEEVPIVRIRSVGKVEPGPILPRRLQVIEMGIVQGENAIGKNLGQDQRTEDQRHLEPHRAPIGDQCADGDEDDGQNEHRYAEEPRAIGIIDARSDPH